jgi:hypothetical protein
MTMTRKWNVSEWYATQWYGVEGEIEVTFDLDGHIRTIVDLRGDVETGTFDPLIVADFR